MSARRSSGSSTAASSAARLRPASTSPARNRRPSPRCSKARAIETLVVANASALKCAYAGWTKGSGALLLAIREFARAEGVWEPLAEEWERRSRELAERLAAAERSAAAKGWRWIGEMEEIAAAFVADGLPPGFHEAAADVYRKG